MKPIIYIFIHKQTNKKGKQKQILQLNTNDNSALWAGGRIPTQQHAHPDVPSKDLETGRREGDTRLGPQIAPSSSSGFLVVCSWHSTLHVILPGQEGWWVQEVEWGVEEGTGQDGKSSRGSIRKGKLWWVARS